jgi:hypothetical protein
MSFLVDSFGDTFKLPGHLVHEEGTACTVKAVPGTKGKPLGMVTIPPSETMGSQVLCSFYEASMDAVQRPDGCGFHLLKVRA